MSEEIDIFAEDNQVQVKAFIPQNAVVNEWSSSISVGNVTTLDPGENATVANSGTAENPVLDFGIPRGANGYGSMWGDIGGDIYDQTDLQNILSALTSRIAALESSIPTTGIVVASPMASLNGFLLCDGRAISRTTYANLYALIGTKFGNGDGINTFNVPDYRGCFLRGFGGESAVDMYTKQGSAVPNITGTFAGQRGVSSSGALAAIPTPYQGAAEHWVTREYDYSISLDASRSSNVYKNVNEVRPTNYAVNYFIKY